MIRKIMMAINYNKTKNLYHKIICNLTLQVKIILDQHRDQE